MCTHDWTRQARTSHFARRHKKDLRSSRQLMHATLSGSAQDSQLARPASHTLEANWAETPIHGRAVNVGALPSPIVDLAKRTMGNAD